MLASIVGYFQRGMLTGLSFVYQSNTTRSVGITATSDRQAIQVVDGEQIICFSITARASDISKLEVRAELTTMCVWRF